MNLIESINNDFERKFGDFYSLNEHQETYSDVSAFYKHGKYNQYLDQHFDANKLYNKSSRLKFAFHRFGNDDVVVFAFYQNVKIKEEESKSFGLGAEQQSRCCFVVSEDAVINRIATVIKYNSGDYYHDDDYFRKMVVRDIGASMSTWYDEVSDYYSDAALAFAQEMVDNGHFTVVKDGNYNIVNIDRP